MAPELLFLLLLLSSYPDAAPAALTLALSEYLRIYFGIKLIGIAETIYGLLLLIFIIFLPTGIYGSLRDKLQRRRGSHATTPTA